MPVKSRLALLRGRDSGFLYMNGAWTTDRAAVPPLSDADLRSLAQVADNAITFTAVPPGSGVRIGIDRDLDGVLDGDEHP